MLVIKPMEMKQTIFFLLFCCGWNWAAWAQQFPSKDTWEHPLFARVPRVSLPQQNNAELRAEELSLRTSGRAPQFAKAILVNFHPGNSGRWEELAEGQSRWRLGIRSPGAYSLNLGFTQFYLPSGAEFYIYHGQTGEKTGPFRSADNEDHAEFWSPVIPSDELLLEVNLPTPQKSDLRLQLSYVNHDFMNFSQLRASDCHIDIICGNNNNYAVVDKFRDVAQSVGLITLRGTSICTGYLVNNGKEDCRPYFITARHCQSRAADAPSLVAYWNFQNSFCRKPNTTANASPGDGKLLSYNSGMRQRASNSNSDFTLLELDDPVVPDANAYFAGWNATSQTPSDGVAIIHHAATEEKRFSYSSQGTYLANWGSSAQVPNGSHLIVPRWDIGSTEDGSSGAPLFNQQGQVIGQLHGGTALCGNTGYDSFGSFDASWDAGSNLNNRLLDWLDPNRNTLTQMPGRWHYQCGYGIELEASSQVLCGQGKVTWSLRVGNPQTESIRLSILNLPTGLQAQFANNPTTSSQVNLEISNESNTLSGFQNIRVQAIIGKDTLRRLFLLEVVPTPRPVQALAPQDGDELVPLPVQLRWNKGQFAQRYTVLLARDAAFTNIVGRYKSNDTTYQINDLDLKGEYYWKVWGINSCDTNQVPTAYQQFSIAPSIRVSVLPDFQARCQGDSMIFVLKSADSYQGSTTLTYRLRPALPLSLSFSQDPLKINAGTILQAKAKNLRQLRPGSYTLTFYTRQNNLRDSVSVNFDIAAPPSVPTLNTPAATAVLLNKRPLLSWSSSGTELRYELEVARDSLFTNLAWMTSLDLSEFQRNQDLTAGRYFWRVKASNRCATRLSRVQSFTVFESNLQKINDLDVGVEPIPSSGKVNVHLSAPIDGAQFELYNLSGQFLETFVPGRIFQDWSLDLGRYPAGMYVLRLKHRQSSVGLRVILQR